MRKQKATIEDVLEIVEFLKDTGATKTDLQKLATSDDLNQTKNEIMNQMDGFIGLHQKLDTELTALRSKYDRLEAQIQQVAKHLQLQLH